MEDGASRLIAATVSAESPMTLRRDRMVADTVTGASIRMREGILQPAGEEQQHAQLQRVVGEIERGLAVAETRAAAARQRRHDVERRRGRDRRERAPIGSSKPKP